MGNFASRVHSKEDGKVYNILPLGDMPTVVFGRVIKENSVPGMQYYFSDGRVKFKKSGSETMSNGGGWDAVIPFIKENGYDGVQVSYDGDTYLYRRYKNGDSLKNPCKKPPKEGKGKEGKEEIFYNWVCVNNSANMDIDSPDIDWGDINISDYFYTNSETPQIGSYDLCESGFEIIAYKQKITQLPVIFTVPEDLDFSRMNDVEYVKQFCRTAVNLNANTMSANFVIRGGKIICVKNINFEHNKSLTKKYDTKEGNYYERLDNNVYKSRFLYKYFKKRGRTRIEDKGVSAYRMFIKNDADHCLHNEFAIIPVVKRNRHKFYKSSYEYKAYRYGTSRNTDAGHFRYWKWKLK